MIGATIGNYRVTGKLGAGGMGAVYVAQHTMIGRHAALKVLLPDLSSSKRLVHRFFNEAKAASAIKHPGIVEIFDFGFHHGQAFILMEYLEGETLEARLRRESVLPMPSALNLLRQVAGALAAAHDTGIVHRDLKPDNIFIIADPEVAGGERIKILDFGIAKLSRDEGADLKTRTGTVMGTPAYMSPEQCRGAEQVDHRADLYSLGCILYRMLCGQPPFVSKYSGDVLAMQIMTEPSPPTNLAPATPLPVSNFILRLLSKDAAMRPQDARALMAELEQVGHASLSGAFQGRMPTNYEVSGTLRPSQGPSTTTLAGSAGMVAGAPTVSTIRPQRSRAPMVIGAVLAIAAIAAIGLASAGMFSDQSGGASTEAASNAAAPTAPAKVPATQRIEIASTPENAVVMRGDELLGNTPLKLEPPGPEGMTVTLKKDGYIEHTIELPGALDEHGKVAVTMDKERAEKPADSGAKNATSQASGQDSGNDRAGAKVAETTTQTTAEKSRRSASKKSSSSSKKSARNSKKSNRSTGKNSGKKSSKSSGKKSAKNSGKNSGTKSGTKRDEDGFMIGDL